MLTAAVRPGLELPVVPREGFRLDVYRDRNGPLARARSWPPPFPAKNLFDVFLELLAPLGDMRRSSCWKPATTAKATHHRDLFREHIDLPVLQSHFCDFEELLLNDGCTGVAVISTSEHRWKCSSTNTSCWSSTLTTWSRSSACCAKPASPRDDSLKLITEGEHLHSTDPHHGEQFEQLCCRVGIAEPAERVNW